MKDCNLLHRQLRLHVWRMVLADVWGQTLKDRSGVMLCCFRMQVLEPKTNSHRDKRSSLLCDKLRLRFWPLVI
jgi:hypothetical protein